MERKEISFAFFDMANEYHLKLLTQIWLELSLKGYQPKLEHWADSTFHLMAYTPEIK